MFEMNGLRHRCGVHFEFRYSRDMCGIVFETSDRIQLESQPDMSEEVKAETDSYVSKNTHTHHNFGYFGTHYCNQAWSNVGRILMIEKLYFVLPRLSDDLIVVNSGHF